MVCIIVREAFNLPTNFGVSRTFRPRLIGQHMSDASVTLRPLPLTLEVTALVDDPGLRPPSVYQVEVRRSSRSVDMIQFRSQQ